MNAPECCLDEGCSIRLRSQVRDPSDLEPGGRFHSVMEMVSHSKVLNASIEDNFARHNSCARTARGSFCCTEAGFSSF